MKYYLLLTLTLFFCENCIAQKCKNYIDYHKQIIEAENELFLKGNIDKGLSVFKKTFEDYDFAFVDDCIEAFQLALQFKNEPLALAFIKKAIKNGFEPHLLSLLNMGCPCNYYYKKTDSVIIYKPFLVKYAGELDAYQQLTRANYLKRINPAIIESIFKRHVKEQLFKNYLSGLSSTKKEQYEEFLSTNADNMHYIDSLAEKGIFPGERNMGIYTRQLAIELGLPEHSINNYLLKVLHNYMLSGNTYVPITGEEAYFEASALYVIMYHSNNPFEKLYKYKDAAIQLGNMHPREFERLRTNQIKQVPTDSLVYLAPGEKDVPNHVLVNQLRVQRLLPTLEIDSAKHAFAHKYNLQLFFGFNNTAR